jgi:hypothetical protein
MIIPDNYYYEILEILKLATCCCGGCGCFCEDIFLRKETESSFHKQCHIKAETLINKLNKST